MKDFTPKSKKSKPIKKIINEALEILESIGIPMNSKAGRTLEQMGMSFLALLDVKKNWNSAKSVADNYGLTSKEVITYFNNNFEDQTSLGSYDDVPRRYIKLLLVADFVVPSGVNPNANYNSSKRKYSIPTFVKDLVVHFKTDKWSEKLSKFNAGKVLLRDEIKRERNLGLLPVVLPNGGELEFSPGSHNELQKQVIEVFLPKFGSNCRVLYVGDGANRSLLKLSDDLEKLNFFDLSHGMLPDIVAHSKKKNWLFLIEAYYSTGAVTEIRRKEMLKNLRGCRAEPIFVTAFLTREEFKKQALDIAWETEVWTADHPDHLIHFNGHKYLSPF